MKQSEGLTPPTAKTPYYQCRFYDDTGHLHRRSTGQADYHQAWWAYQALREAAGLEPAIDGNVTLGSVLAEYELDAKRRLKSISSHYKSCKALYQFWRPETPWQHICNPRHALSIVAYQKHREDVDKVKASTVRRELGVLSAAANHSIKQGVDIRNPRQMVTIKVITPEYYHLNQDQAGKLLKATWNSQTAIENDRALHDFTKISLYTGMRTGEVLGITLDRVDLTHNRIYLDDSKASKPHNVPIHDEIADCVARRIAWAKKHHSRFIFVNPKTQRELNDIAQPFSSFITPFKAACRRAGIPVNKKGSNVRGMRVYDLRHTFATWLAINGVSLERIADLLNHSDIKMTQKYAHHCPEGRIATLGMLPKLK